MGEGSHDREIENVVGGMRGHSRNCVGSRGKREEEIKERKKERKKERRKEREKKKEMKEEKQIERERERD